MAPPAVARRRRAGRIRMASAPSTPAELRRSRHSRAPGCPAGPPGVATIPAAHGMSGRRCPDAARARERLRDSAAGGGGRTSTPGGSRPSTRPRSRLRAGSGGGRPVRAGTRDSGSAQHERRRSRPHRPRRPPDRAVGGHGQRVRSHPGAGHLRRGVTASARQPDRDVQSGTGARLARASARSAGRLGALPPGRFAVGVGEGRRPARRAPSPCARLRPLARWPPGAAGCRRRRRRGHGGPRSLGLLAGRP